MKAIPDEPAYKEMELFLKYNKLNTASLKNYLRWNRQTMTGTKDVLVEKCKDGEMNGAIPPCPKCSEINGKSATTLKITKEGNYKCGGWFDKDIQSMRACHFKSRSSELARDPWAQNEQESREIIKDESDEQSGTKLIADTPFPIDTSNTPRDNAKLIMDQALKEGISLPSNVSEAMQACGRAYMTSEVKMNADGDDIINGRSILVDLATQFKTVSSKESAKKERSSACANAKNIGLLEAFNEMITYMKKKGEPGYKMKHYYNAQSWIQSYENVIENPMQYSKGKTKVEGIGKGTATKMKEFLDTGTISKLEELRAYDASGGGGGGGGADSFSSSSSSGATSY